MSTVPRVLWFWAGLPIFAFCVTACIAADFDNRPELLVQILVRIVQQHGWISSEVIRQVADILNLSRAEVHGVVEYYHDLRTTPPGKHIVKVCAAEACQAVGGRKLAAHAHATAGRDVTLEPVYCLGNCGGKRERLPRAARGVAHLRVPAGSGSRHTRSPHRPDP